MGERCWRGIIGRRRFGHSRLGEMGWKDQIVVAVRVFSLSLVSFIGYAVWWGFVRSGGVMLVRVDHGCVTYRKLWMSFHAHVLL